LPVRILKTSEEIDIAEMDGMVERILTRIAISWSHGATSFVPMSRYLVQDGVVEPSAAP